MFGHAHSGIIIGIEPIKVSHAAFFHDGTNPGWPFFTNERKRIIGAEKHRPAAL
jgi:hypothetical protein